jgi:outer membrane protein assembly factor BamB
MTAVRTTAAVAAIAAGLLLVGSGCGAKAQDRQVRTDATGRPAAARLSPAPGATSRGCGRQPPLRAWAEDITDHGAVAWTTPLPANASRYGSTLPPKAVGRIAAFASGGSVVGLHLSSGRMVWRWRSDQTIDGLWAWQRLVVVLADQAGARTRLIGLDAATGTVRWQLRLPGGLFGGQAATADGGLAMVSQRGTIEVVSLATGRLRWTQAAAPQPVAGATAGLVLAASGGRLRGYDDQTGRLEWTRQGMPQQAQLQVLDGLVLVTSGATGPGISTAVIAVRPGSGRVAWRFDPGMPVTVLSAGPAGIAVATYVPYRRLYLLDARTGHVRWRVVTAVTLGSVPLVTGTGVISDEGGVAGFQALHVVSRAAASGRPLWDEPSAEQVTGAVLLVGPDAVVQGNSEEAGPPSKVTAYDVATGVIAWQSDLPAFAEQAPASAAGGLLLEPADLVQGCPLSLSAPRPTVQASPATP